MKFKAVVRTLGCVALAAAVISTGVACSSNSSSKSQAEKLLEESKEGILDEFTIEIKKDKKTGEKYSVINVPESLKGKITESDIYSVSQINKKVLESIGEKIPDKIKFKDENNKTVDEEDVKKTYNMEPYEEAEKLLDEEVAPSEEEKDSNNLTRAKVLEAEDADEKGAYITLTQEEFDELSKTDLLNYITSQKDKEYDFFTIVIEKESGDKYGLTWEKKGDKKDKTTLKYGKVSKDTSKVDEETGTITVEGETLAYEGDAKELDYEEETSSSEENADTAEENNSSIDEGSDESSGEGEESGSEESGDEGSELSESDTSEPNVESSEKSEGESSSSKSSENSQEDSKWTIKPVENGITLESGEDAE